MSLLKRLFAVSSVKLRLSKLASEKDAIEAKLEAALREIEYMSERLQTFKTIVDNAKTTMTKQSTTIDSLRHEIDTLKELTVPGLVASHQVLTDRWEEESRIIAMRRGTGEGDREAV